MNDLLQVVKTKKLQLLMILFLIICWAILPSLNGHSYTEILHIINFIVCVPLEINPILYVSYFIILLLTLRLVILLAVKLILGTKLKTTLIMLILLIIILTILNIINSNLTSIPDYMLENGRNLSIASIIMVWAIIFDTYKELSDLSKEQSQK